MNLQPSIPQNIGLLVSVRSLDEATIALNSNVVSIIDAKEPADGSLGCVSLETARSIGNKLPREYPKSIALGEVVDWPVWHSADSTDRDDVLSKFQFAKLGLSSLAGQKDWVSTWQDCLSHIPPEVDRVAVAYADEELADCPPIESIVEAGVELGCCVLLVDTFTKSEGSLFDHIAESRLEKAIQLARAKGLKIVLAGSLSNTNIPKACSMGPDLIAVRGAVCGSNRTSSIEFARIKNVAVNLRTATRIPRDKPGLTQRTQ